MLGRYEDKIRIMFILKKLLYAKFLLIAKEATEIILTYDDFASIVNAIEEGRAVYANIKKFTTYIFTSNTPEAIPFILLNMLWLALRRRLDTIFKHKMF